ncbi:MAG: DUF2304 family protein [Candidatus Magasanikbacteria bacterium]|nr:DUF2304 family protein [Candidatus Magasanikbacteria bacterium]
MLILFQILFILFAGFAVFNVISRKRSGLLGQRAVFFWIFFWILGVIVVIWPNSSSILAAYLGIGRGTDLVIYISLALLFFLVFKLNVKLDSLNRDLTKIVRKDALDNNE